MSGKTIVILGAGVGGLVAAATLRRRLPAEHRIVLVEKEARHAFAASFLWLLSGERTPEQVARPLASLVPAGVELVQAEARALDLAARRVQTTARDLTYDYLILALGATLAPDAIPGLAEGTHAFFTAGGAQDAHDALRAFSGQSVAVVVSALPYKCPGAPHEAAMLVADYLRRKRRQNGVAVHLYTPEPQPMPVAGPALGEAVRGMLAQSGVEFHPQHKLTSVNPARRELAFEGKESVRHDLILSIPPHRGPSLARPAGLANEAGWIPVDRATLQTPHPGVYAIGDATTIAIPGRWKPEVPLMLPKAGVFAHAQAQAVARRIAAEIGGHKPLAEFDGAGFCMLEAGDGRAGFAFGHFYAQPAPAMRLGKTGRLWHWGKVLFEQWWLASPGVRRDLLRGAIVLGGKALRLPIDP